jgi:hypothetical protein
VRSYNAEAERGNKEAAALKAEDERLAKAGMDLLDRLNRFIERAAKCEDKWPPAGRADAPPAPATPPGCSPTMGGAAMAERASGCLYVLRRLVGRPLTLGGVGFLLVGGCSGLAGGWMWILARATSASRSQGSCAARHWLVFQLG